MCLVLIVTGTVGVVAGAALGQFIVAGISALLPLLGARLVGWVEIEGEIVRHRRLIGDSTVLRFSDVREVGLGMHQVGKSKWWYPEVEMKNGSSIKFLMLKSLSGKDTVSRVEKIFRTGMEAFPDAPEDEFTTVTSAGELEFLLTPGYDSFKRQRAEAAEAKAAVADLEFGLPNPTPPTPASSATALSSLELAPETAEPIVAERRLRDIPPIAPNLLPAEGEPAPEVFEPRGFADEFGTSEEAVIDKAVRKLKLVPPPVPQKIPTTIEVPETPVASDRRAAKPTKPALQPVVIEPAGQPKVRRDEPDRQFTSLFSRAA